MYADLIVGIYARKLCLTNFAVMLHLIAGEIWKALVQSGTLTQKGSTNRIMLFPNKTLY